MENEFERVSATPDRLREAMDLSGKKQVDLVRITGIDKGSISNYLSGRYEPKQEAIYKLAMALDVSEMWLWGYNVPMERPIAQKENDELAGLVERIKQEKDFRQLIMRISHLKPQQLEAVKNLLEAFPQD